jgi:hypothetical protein
MTSNNLAARFSRSRLRSAGLELSAMTNAGAKRAAAATPSATARLGYP